MTVNDSGQQSAQAQTDETNLLQQKVDTNIAQTTAENKAPEKEEDPNWRAFREARKQDRIHRESAEKRAAEKEAEVAALKAAMEAAFAKGGAVAAPQQGYQGSYLPEETEDERIEKKVAAAIAQREAAAERARAEREQQEFGQRLVQAYPDFNQTIAHENLDYLDYHHPEVSAAIKMLPDGFEKWRSIYHLVKKFVPNTANARKDAARADANLAKPRSMSGTGITQPGQTGGAYLTEERRAQNWERMQRTLNRLS